MGISGLSNNLYTNKFYQNNVDRQSKQTSSALPVTNQTDSKSDYSKILVNHAEQIKEKIRNGETEPTYQIGGQSFTEKEWKKLVEKVDRSIEKIQAEQSERFEKQKAEQTGVADISGTNSNATSNKVTDSQIQALLENNNDKTNGVCGTKTVYKMYESENYKIVPDNEAGCFDIYNKQGEHLGAFAYSDIKVRQDTGTGKQFLISEHGTMSYDALVLDKELKKDLQSAMGVEQLETESLQGFTLKTHSGTGIQYLLRDGEEGRGGKVLLQNEADREKYEALAETYFNKYPNLINDKNAAYIWADLEIKGLAQHTQDGIISMGFNGMSYHDNLNNKNNWSVLLSGDSYQAAYEWLLENSNNKEIQKFSTWQKIFSNIDSQYERVWSDEEERQGYLNN